MVIIKKLINKDFPAELAKEINNLAKEETFSPIWQTIGWNRMLQESNYSSTGIFIGITEKNKLVNYAIIEKRKVGFGMHGNFIIGGPISGIGLEMLEDEITKSGIEEGAAFTQIEPLNELSFTRFKKGSFKKFIEKNTAIISLGQDKEQILANMKQKGRYNIKIAEKNEIHVDKAAYCEENVRIFYDLLNETRSRDEFSINSFGYFNNFCRYLNENNLGGLYFAKKDSEVLAAGIFVFFGKIAIYYYGASTSDNDKRKFMPAYLLQWAVIEESKERGFEKFDFLGIAGKDDKDSRLSGVTDFKLKLTNETLAWPESNIVVHSKSKFLLLSIKNYLKKFKR